MSARVILDSAELRVRRPSDPGTDCTRSIHGARRLAAVLLLMQSSPAWCVSLPELHSVTDGHSRRIEARVDGCPVSLEWRAVEPALIHYRNDCSQTTDDKAALLASMLQRLLTECTADCPVRTLFIGRMVETFPGFAQRLALAASRSRRWDSVRARRESGYANRFYAEFARQPGMFVELEAALRPLGFTVTLSAVEKVLAARPKETPFGDWLVAQGVANSSRVPFDALAWFRLAPVEQPGMTVPQKGETRRGPS
jgi:hypothetical protein